MIRDGADPDVLRLLMALEAALSGVDDPPTRREALALAEQAVTEAERRLDAELPPAPVGLLVAWLELADAAGEMRLTRAITAACVELAPPPDATPAELDTGRVDDWLRLVDTLERIGPDEAQALDLGAVARFLRHREVIDTDAGWEVRATWRPHDEPDSLHGLVARVLADLDPPAT